MEFTIQGKIKPYVRMTQRSKWSDPQAQEYLSSRSGIALQLKAQMAAAGWEMLPASTPLVVVIAFVHANGFHNCDLDNQIKATMDAAQGIVFHNDCWIDAISARREQGDADVIHIVIDTL